MPLPDVAAPVAHAAEALRAAGVEVDATTRRRAEYSTDASLYRVVPLGVAFPRDADDVVAIVETCRSLDISLTARCRGTSVAGNAIGPGVIVDVSRHLTRIHSLDPDQRTAVVEPGVVLDELQRAAAPHGLRFGPEPSTHDRCGLGGMIGNNACGSRALGFGRTVDHVRALDLVTGRGAQLHVSRGSHGSAILQEAIDVARIHEAAIGRELDRFPRQVSGYGLHHLLEDRGTDVAKALVGSEGTCGVVTGATVALVPIPRLSHLLVLGYPDMASAADAVPGLLAGLPRSEGDDASAPRLIAVEGLDRRIVDIVRLRRGLTAVPPLPDGNGWLFVECGGDELAALEGAVQQCVRAADAIDARTIRDADEARALWRIREDGAGLVARASQEPVHAGWEDAAVPPEHLGQYLRAFDELLDEHDLKGVPYGHFGDGCIHVRISFPLNREGGTRIFRAFIEEAAVLVAGFGGSLSGEHGDGRARSDLLKHMYSDEILNAFAAFKSAFDPDGVMNPGVLVRPSPPDTNLRAYQPQRPLDASLGFSYDDDGGSFTSAMQRCVGIGKCTSGAAGGKVMCPSYVATGDEKDSTRGRARVLQEMVVGDVVTGEWRSPEIHEALDLCLSCKGCMTDCPTGVDMATYKAEVLYQVYRRRLRPRSHYSLGWLPQWARVASAAPRLSSVLLRNRTIASVAKLVGGIDARRPLPTLAPETFDRWFVRHPPPANATTRPRAVLWPDTFTNRFTPAVGIASVRVLEDAGFAVQVPSPNGLCCGLTWISTGQLDTARRRLRRTIDALDTMVSSDVPLIGLEPSCTAVFRSDALELLGRDNQAAHRVAQSTRTLAEFLTSVPGWRPPSLDKMEVVAQPHCHQHAIMGWEADLALIRGAGAKVARVGGCCGLAGNFGVERGHYELSLAVAGNELLPAVNGAPDAVVLADGFSCRTQLDHLTNRRGVHLAELLASRLNPLEAGEIGG